MAFHLIDLEQWDRKEYYEHYAKKVRCGYSITVHLDISTLVNERLYPAMLWLLTDTVNEHQAFRYTNSSGQVGFFDDMHPSYTIFNHENKNFSVIWTEFHQEYNIFLSNYEKDVAQYSCSRTLAPKSEKPANTFDVSMIPWVPFSSMNLNLYDGADYLSPIFTMGQIFKENGRTRLPLAIQVHHAVCDGYHVGMFLQSLQEKLFYWKK